MPGDRVRARLAELVADTASVRTRFGLTDLGPPVGRVRYVVRRITGAGPEVAWVVSGASTAGRQRRQGNTWRGAHGWVGSG